MNIIPSIIGRDFEEVNGKVELVNESTKWIQVDISDGVFAPQETWPYYENEDAFSEINLADFVRTDVLKMEVHLMVKNPELILDKWLSTGADRILVHYESTDEDTLKDIIARVKDEEIEVGIVLKMETPIDVLDNFMNNIDVVQFMSIDKIGAYGEPFDDEVFNKIEGLLVKYPGVRINVDGGVNSSNLKKLADLGVENAIVGSAVFGKDESGAGDFDKEKGEVKKRIENLTCLSAGRKNA
ncbi:MAG: hypothetical protein HZA94_03050 [Candidatus Vogelbacteria bacterium]|nr:hypothetical protein [Candidatus Vogelbacteria bacterium]